MTNSTQTPEVVTRNWDDTANCSAAAGFLDDMAREYRAQHRPAMADIIANRAAALMDLAQRLCPGTHDFSDTTDTCWACAAPAVLDVATQ